MPRHRPIGLAATVVLVSAAVVAMGIGAFAVGTRKPAVGGISQVAQIPGAGLADLDARREALAHRIEEGRSAGALRGIGYMELLGEQQSLLVAQRRAEAQPEVTPELRRQLIEGLDRASANIDRHLGR